jgi:hypothetical protein
MQTLKAAARTPPPPPRPRRSANTEAAGSQDPEPGSSQVKGEERSGLFAPNPLGRPSPEARALLQGEKTASPRRPFGETEEDRTRGEAEMRNGQAWSGIHRSYPFIMASCGQVGPATWRPGKTVPTKVSLDYTMAADVQSANWLWRTVLARPDHSLTWPMVFDLDIPPIRAHSLIKSMVASGDLAEDQHTIWIPSFPGWSRAQTREELESQEDPAAQARGAGRNTP